MFIQTVFSLLQKERGKFSLQFTFIYLNKAFLVQTANSIFIIKKGWERFSGFRSSKEVRSAQTLTVRSFSIRANREGMSADCRVPSSVVQAAKAGMKTWWTALTTRSDGSPSESSISSKPWKTSTKNYCFLHCCCNTV